MLNHTVPLRHSLPSRIGDTGTDNAPDVIFELMIPLHKPQNHINSAFGE